MEENNRKGPGVFYAVVGVATLVVAIIGATFAYFSASVTAADDNDTIQGTTAKGASFSLAITEETETTGALVPLDTVEPWYEENEASQMPAALANGCVDDAGNTVCKVYSLTLSSEDIDTTATFNAIGNLDITVTSTYTDPSHLMWKLLTDADTELSGATANTEDDGVVSGLLTDANGDEFTSTNNEKIYYVVVWLEETGTAQDDPDASISFTGTAEFNLVDANGNTVSGLTATFASA